LKGGFFEGLSIPNRELDLFFAQLPECETESAAVYELIPKCKSNSQIREPLDSDVTMGRIQRAPFI